MRFLAAVVVTLFAPFAFANELPINPVVHTCLSDLRSGDPSFRLGIGVLAEGTDGSLVLGMSPYAGSVHSAIVDSLAASIEIKQILWMGENRRLIVDGKPVFSEANETSGYYAIIRDTGIEVGTRTVPVQNSYKNIPLSNRTVDFTGHVFDEKKMRLAKELQDVQGDVRHSIGNSLQVLSSVTQLIKSPRATFDSKTEVLNLIRGKHSADLILVRWLILNLFEEERIEATDMEVMMALINAYTRPMPVLAEIEVTDLEALAVVMGKISRMINPNLDGIRVDLYKLR